MQNKSALKWWLLAFIGLLVLVCAVALIGSGLIISRFNKPVSEPTMEPAVFEYCGAKLISLCVVSFGRDAFGDTIINLYVPQTDYPPFYLKVIRRSGEGRYECETNKNFKTSVYCTGDPINLGEGFEIQLLAEQDDRVLAQGTFTLTAFLVKTPVVGDAVSETRTPRSTSESNVDETATPRTVIEDETPSPTPSSTDSSYPNYP